MEAILDNSRLGRCRIMEGFEDGKRNVGNAEVANGAGRNVGLERAPGFERLRKSAKGRVEDDTVEIGCVIDRLAGLVGVAFAGTEML